MQTPGNPSEDEKTALEGIAVSPPVPSAGDKPPADSEPPEVREGADAESDDRLKADPSDVDAKLDIGLDETFPSSDAPANTQPGSDQPAPSTGFDEEEERRLAEQRGDS